jgi:hypothetical protein
MLQCVVICDATSKVCQQSVSKKKKKGEKGKNVQVPDVERSTAVTWKSNAWNFFLHKNKIKKFFSQKQNQVKCMEFLKDGQLFLSTLFSLDK